MAHLPSDVIATGDVGRVLDAKVQRANGREQCAAIAVVSLELYEFVDVAIPLRRDLLPVGAVANPPRAVEVPVGPRAVPVVCIFICRGGGRIEVMANASQGHYAAVCTNVYPLRA